MEFCREYVGNFQLHEIMSIVYERKGEKFNHEYKKDQGQRYGNSACQ